MPYLDSLFTKAEQEDASDIHLATDTVPYLRIHGTLHRVTGVPPLAAERLMRFVEQHTTPEQRLFLETHGALDFACTLSSVRYRVNAFKQHRGLSIAFRMVSHRLPSLEELGLPALLEQLILQPKGLILVTGSVGSGKTTTLNAMIAQANTLRHGHILTIEDPIEYVHRSQQCLVSQREVGQDTPSFAAALRSALREDPDILLIGELRDVDTIRLAIQAAETGQLVLATLHTLSAPKAIDRLLGALPAAEQALARTSLAESLLAVVSQVLLPRAEGTGRVPALEVLLATPAVRNMIRENAIFQLPSLMQTSQHLGMQTLQHSVEQLLKCHAITQEIAKPYLTPFLASRTRTDTA